MGVFFGDFFSEVDHADLVLGVSSGFSSRSAHARLHVCVCAVVTICGMVHPNWIFTF